MFPGFGKPGTEAAGRGGWMTEGGVGLGGVVLRVWCGVTGGLVCRGSGEVWLGGSENISRVR